MATASISIVQPLVEIVIEGDQANVIPATDADTLLGVTPGATGLLLLATATAGAARTVLGIDSDDTVTFGGLISPTLRASSSAGVKLQNSSGTDVLLIGAGPGTGITAYGQINGTALALSGGITSATHVIGADPGGSELLRGGGSGFFGGYVRANIFGDAVGTYALRATNTGAGTGTGGGIALGYSTASNGTFAGIVGKYEGSGVSLSMRVAVNNSAVEPTEVGKFDNSATAEDMRFLLWDVTAGSMKRVSRGASDSGGTGFRVLRIPN